MVVWLLLLLLLLLLLPSPENWSPTKRTNERMHERGGSDDHIPHAWGCVFALTLSTIKVLEAEQVVVVLVVATVEDGLRKW